MEKTIVATHTSAVKTAVAPKLRGDNPFSRLTSNHNMYYYPMHIFLRLRVIRLILDFDGYRLKVLSKIILTD